MFTPRLSAVARNTSGVGATPKSVSATRSLSLLHSGRKTQSNVQRNQSIDSSLHTSQPIEEKGSYSLQSFGTPLPVLVLEAISLVERSRDVSARLDPSGWACLVCGRRLFVWRFKLGPGQRLLSAPQCRELTLPASDLAHKADLVCIFPGNDRQVPSAVAVSPEGTVRHWPSIAHDGTSIEVNAELQGQECFSLVPCQPYGCILTTTTGTLILITPSFGNSENVLVCRNLTVAKGVLARFGRRVSSFIFGGIPSQTIEQRLVRILVADEPDVEMKILYVLTGNSLQKWEIGEDNGDKLIVDYDIDQFVREKFIEHVWNRDMIHQHQLKVWLIDMQVSKFGLFILAAAVSPKEPQRLRFALGVVKTQGIQTSFSSFVVLVHSDSYHDSDEDFLGYRLLFPDFNSELACIYRDRLILCVPLFVGEEMDKVELHQPGDHIIGSGSYDKIPLFFLSSYGIVALTSSFLDESGLQDVYDSIRPSFEKTDRLTYARWALTTSTSGAADAPSIFENFNLTCTMAELEVLATSTDKTSQLKAALLLYCRKNIDHCQSLIQDTFPYGSNSEIEVNSSLDNAVTSLSQQTIDDFPATDPRWAETVLTESSITSSMIILHQLDDKQKAHQLFLKFLQSVGLWERLRSVSVNGNIVSTRRLLCEHEEKLVTAKTLRTLQPQYPNLLESAIKVTLRARKVAPSGKLTNQDIFYREVSRVEDVVLALIEVEEDTIKEGASQSIVVTVSSINNIILSVLRQIAQYRQTRSTAGTLSSSSSEIDSFPLSGSREPLLLLSLLTKQYRLTLDHAIGAAQDTNVRGTLHQQMMDLADSVLDGYRCHLQYLESKGVESGQVESFLRKYEQDRPALILPLLDAKQYERAAALAEKYLDFGVLLRLCEATDNNERLQRYLLQFEDQGFSEFTYNWYLKEGKRGKLLSQPALQRESLQTFLRDHHHLSWLQDIQVEHYAKAQRTLKSSGLAERDILARKKTLLGLSKLCALASDALPQDILEEIDNLNEEENLIIYQETLPASVLDSYGFDVDMMRVLSPVELIELYVSDENIGSNEYDFKKALDLLNYVDKETPEETERLRLHIWCRSIMKDSWDEFDDGFDNPLEAGSRTVFFRTVELAFTTGMDVKRVLPNLETLLDCSALEDVKDNANFRFLIQACYEQIERVMT